jgi:SAM-dependent methyltransferase
LPETGAPLEFTGERVVPGLVDPNLFNEHLARYRFAARFKAGRVLDAGCGAGYGTAEFAHAATVIALDVSADALAHASRAFAKPGVQFLQGTCESLPFGDASFDLIAAFEVIEHLERWREMLTEARRVLRPSGVLLVSTPNKAYYSEMRAAAGPNPYHVHEFEYREFEAALEAVFPHVRLWSQNHSDAIAFVPASPAAGTLDACPDTKPGQAHFFVAACSQEPIAETRAFAWLPTTGNVLRERERHIALLESEIDQKNGWLAQAQAGHAKLLDSHEKVLGELKASNKWAAARNQDLESARAVIAGLQQELDAAHAGYRERISSLEAEAEARLAWVHDLESQIARGSDEIARLDSEKEEISRWAQSRDAESARLNEETERLNLKLARVLAELKTLSNSKWVRLGRAFGVTPTPK